MADQEPSSSFEALGEADGADEADASSDWLDRPDALEA